MIYFILVVFLQWVLKGVIFNLTYELLGEINILVIGRDYTFLPLAIHYFTLTLLNYKNAQSTS